VECSVALVILVEPGIVLDSPGMLECVQYCSGDRVVSLQPSGEVKNIRMIINRSCRYAVMIILINKC
jgi:hypothetical protein